MSVRAQAVQDRGVLETLVIRSARFLAHPVFFVLEFVFHLTWIALLILMQETHESRIAELREETDLQVALHAEREATKLLRLMLDVHRALGIKSPELDDEFDEMARPLDPDRLRESLEERLRRADEN